MVRRPIAERSPHQAMGGRGQALGKRPTTRLGKAESSPHREGRIVAGIAATGGLRAGWRSWTRDRRRLSPPVATDYRRPATLARTTQARQPDQPQERTTPTASRRGAKQFHSQLAFQRHDRARQSLPASKSAPSCASSRMHHLIQSPTVLFSPDSQDNITTEILQLVPCNRK